MEIIRAVDMGMCFGVRDALQAADGVERPEEVTSHGELVHNPAVIKRLGDAGFRQSPEGDRGIPDTPLVLITAHGVSQSERTRLEAAGKQLIDTTCPLVRRVHDAAMEMASEGRHVLLIGKRGHVEVRGIVEDLASFDVIERAEEVSVYPSKRLGVVCQTTMPPDVVREVCSTIQRHNPSADIRLIDTVCQPTRLRQQAMLELLVRVDAVVVVGGRNSNNTRRLVKLCRENATPVCHVERREDLDPHWFADVQTVGLTAGTSTLDETLDGVHEALRRIGAQLAATRSEG
jgi:4-hydroxy-3-methylbut-2-enyl diphosphate reductase